MSSQQYYNSMAPFWDFVADLEERGLANGWFGRRGGPNRGMNRAANRGEGAEANVRPNAWTQAPAGFGPGPQRFRGGPGRRNGPRRNQQENATPAEKAELLTPESEKEVENEKTVIFDQSETEKSTEEKPTRRGLGARRGGRGGKGMGPRARRAAAAAAAAQETDASATEQSGDEKATSKKGGPRKAGRGGPRGGRGLGRGNGQGMGPRRAARIAAAYEQMMAGPYGQFFMEPPMGGSGPRRGGPGFGRGNGFGPRGGRHGLAGPHAFPAEFGFGPRHGPGACRGGRGMGAGRGRGNGMGRGRGAANGARQMNQPNALPLRGAPGRFAHGPQAMHQHQHASHGPHAGRACPHHNRRQAQRAATPESQTGPKNGGDREHFRPLVDVYDHPEAYIIHASLPGAKKEDVEVNFDSEKSVLIIKGDISREGDEEMMSTLTKKERRIGAFQRRVKLGTKEKPASVDVDAIMASIVDGVLKVQVPKYVGGFVEVRKVDIN